MPDFFDSARQLESLGTYANGCLLGEHRLGFDNPGLLKLFEERERDFGNSALVGLLKALGRAYQEAYLSSASPAFPFERIQLGDLSRKGGGKITRHASHQNGLDVDVVYLRNDYRETSPRRGADASFDEEFVKAGQVTSNFDTERNWWLLRWLRSSAQVDRIFVDREIKRHFCRKAAHLEPDEDLRQEILRLLRPYPNHGDHLHLRLACPAGDAKCVASAPVEPGSGCDRVDIEIYDVDEPELLGLAAQAFDEASSMKALGRPPRECRRPR